MAELLHNQQHAAEDAREDALAHRSGGPVEQHHHDETNCAVHAQLHMPFTAAGWVPFLVSLGLLVAFLTLLPISLPTRLSFGRVDCRGPPTFA